MNQKFELVSDAMKQNAINFIRDLPVDQKRPLILDIKEMKRTAQQNRKMWPLLKDLSDQVVWFGNKYDSDDWKDLITALVAKSKRQEQRMAPALDGGVVMFGQRTSKMKISQMVEVIEAIYWFSTEQGVQFSEKSKLEIAWAKRWGGAMRKMPCLFCGKPATLLCDGLIGFDSDEDENGRMMKCRGMFTCDAPMWQDCATWHGNIFFSGKAGGMETKDYCPLCEALYPSGERIRVAPHRKDCAVPEPCVVAH